MMAPHTAPLALASLGFAVFPVHSIGGEPGRLRCGCGSPGCQNAGKHPVAQLARRGLHSATRDQTKIFEWWRVPRNVGIATGSPAIVLDVDPRHGGDTSLARLEAQHGELPTTWRAFTGGGGEHVYFAPPAGVPIANSANRVGAGLDIRGVGGYVVAPPSRHVSGGEYAWNVEGHPEEVALAPMPAWLVEACGVAAPIGAKSDLAAVAAAGIVEGARNQTLARIAGLLFRRLDPSQALLAAELVRAFNETRCAPPLDPAELEKILESIAGRELRRRRAAS